MNDLLERIIKSIPDDELIELKNLLYEEINDRSNSAKANAVLSSRLPIGFGLQSSNFNDDEIPF